MVKKLKRNPTINYHSIIFWMIFIVACAVRLAAFGKIPADINQDEAMTGYDALSLLLTGADSWGISHPVYLTGWGSGTSILYALLAKFSFYLFDVSIWALRLPQAVMSILSCYIFYRLLRIFYDRKTSLTGFFLISIIPWSVMNARWGLDGNIATAFWLLGFYFYCRAIKKPVYLGLSAIFYALTMYAYAGFWVFVVITFIGQWWYLWWFVDKKTQKAVFLSAMLFAVLNLPLLWLILVNYGVVEAYNSAWISVPKLLVWRGQEIGSDDFYFKLTMLFNVLIKQNDGWLSNMIPSYGLFYLFTPVVMLIGIVKLIKKAKVDLSCKKFSFSLCVMGQIAVGLIYASCIYAFSNRMSFLFMPLMIAATLGIMALKPVKMMWWSVIAIYLGSFGFFAHTYFMRYNEMLATDYHYRFSYGLKEALAKAEQIHQKTGATIYLLEEPYIYAKVLFLNKINPYLYRKTVQWYEYPNAFMQAMSFLYYHFIWSADFNQLPGGHIYIAHTDKRPYFKPDTYQVYGNYIVAY